MTMIVRSALLAAGLLAALPSFAQLGGAITAGFITQARGNVAGQSGVGKPRPLAKGQPVRPGMVVDSERNSETVLAFPDGQIGVLGSNGQVRLNNYVYDPGNPSKGDINLNLIEGNLRVVMGEIGQTNPGALKLQVGTASVGLQSSSKTEPADASLVTLGGAVAVTVQEGMLEVRLPDGSVLQVGPGQTLYMNQNGEAQVDTTAKMVQALSQSALGMEIQAQLAESQSFTKDIAQAQAAMAPLTAALKIQASTQNRASAQQPVSPQGPIPAQSSISAPDVPNVQDSVSLELLENVLDPELLAALLSPPGEVSAPVTLSSPPSTTITPTSGAGGGGTPCTASCN